MGDCTGCSKRRLREKDMNLRVSIDIPQSINCTRIEVYHKDMNKPERYGEIASGQTNALIKLPSHARLDECLILVKSLNNLGQPYGQVYVWAQDKLIPYNPEFHKLGMRIEAVIPAVYESVIEEPAEEQAPEDFQDTIRYSDEDNFVDDAEETGWSSEDEEDF